MSKSHFDPTRKENSNELDGAFESLYKRYWGDDLRHIRGMQEGTTYPTADTEKSLDEIHDIMGADRMLLIETGMGSKPIFVEEKTRTFKPHKMKYEWYNSPKDEDLALTVEYHNKKNQPKHRKHMEHKNQLGFIPSVLAFVVHVEGTNKPLVSMLMDYHELLERKSGMDKKRNPNGADGNTSDYISQSELHDNGIVLTRYCDYDTAVFGE